MSLFLTNSGASVVLYGSGIPVSASSPIERGEHPRLLFTSSKYQADIPTVAETHARISGNDNYRAVFDQIVSQCDDRYGTFTQVAPMAMKYAFVAHVLGEGAITGVTPNHTAAEYGAKAADYVANLVSGGGYFQETYSTEMCTPYVYDWAYPFLSPSQRTSLAAFIKGSIATNHWLGQIGKFQNGAIAMLQYIMAGAVAMSGDGIEDAWAQSVIDDFPALVMGSPTAITDSWSAYSGNICTSETEGINYFAYTCDMGLMCLEGYRTAHGLAKTEYYTASTMRQYLNLAQLFAYLLLPYAINSNYTQDGKYHGIWRSHYASTYLEGTEITDVLHHIPSLTAGIVGYLDTTQRGLLRWMQEECSMLYHANTGFGYQDGETGLYYPFRLICGDDSSTIYDPDDEGMALFFTGANGYRVYRESFGNETAGHFLVTFHCPKWGTAAATGRAPTHQSGHWTVSRKGPQVIIRGSKSHAGVGVGGFNRLAFPRIDRVSQGSGDTWGDVREPNVSGREVESSADFIADSWADFCGEVRDRNSNTLGDAEYCFADLTKAYPTATQYTATNAARCALAHTHFFVFRGASLGAAVRVVRFDRWQLISSGTYEPVLTCNYGGEPIVNGTPTAGTPWADCSWTYSGADTITSTVTTEISPGVLTYDGKTVTTILAPASRSVVKYGGPNPSAQMWHNEGSDHPNSSRELMNLYGKWTAPHTTLSTGSPLTSYTSPGANEIGFYGTYIRDLSGGTSGYFLTAHEVGNADLSPVTVEDWSGTLVAARIGNRVAAMPSTSITATSGTIICKTAGTYKVLIAGLAVSAARTLTFGSNINTVSGLDPVDASVGSGDSLTSTASGTLYVQLTVSAPGTGADNTLTIG